MLFFVFHFNCWLNCCNRCFLALESNTRADVSSMPINLAISEYSSFSTWRSLSTVCSLLGKARVFSSIHLSVSSLIICRKGVSLSTSIDSFSSAIGNDLFRTRYKSIAMCFVATAVRASRELNLCKSERICHILSSTSWAMSSASNVESPIIFDVRSDSARNFGAICSNSL